jgi:acyl-homoserine-lactone acylase
MKYTTRIFLCCLLLLLAFNVSVAQQSRHEILWDNYGVPHIYSKTTAGMYYAFGWAQMHNNANLLMELYGKARGRAAEYWGKRFLNNDEIVHRFDLAQVAQKIYSEQHTEYRNYLDAFVKGINDYAKAHPENIGEAYKQVLPITPQDVVAHTVNVLSLTFVAGDNVYLAQREGGTPGSNAMAIAASRSASKHAMLMANPHLAWFGLFTFFEAHLNSPGFEAYGATLVGMPILAIAFNNNLGWTHTVNTMDASTRYELSLKDNGYLLDGAVTLFKTRVVTLKIKQEDGSFKEEQLNCRDAKQGPVISEKDNKAYAVRIAGLDNAYFNEQYHKMAKASNFVEFEAAIRMLQMPMFNIIYADKAGNIMYLDGGNLPVKTEGDFAFWHYKVDGTQSKYIWTKTLPYEQLPKVFNPPSGFVQNANDVPWTCTYPMVLDPKKYPAYIAPYQTWATVDMREQRAMNMIGNNHAVTFNQLIGYKLNTGIELADRLLDDLLLAAEKYPDTTVTKAADVLKSWDRRTDTASRGAILFIQWCNDMVSGGGSVFKNTYNIDQPVSTPNGLADPQYAAQKLKQAATEMMKIYGSLDFPWGQVYRFRSGKTDLPANGAPSNYGSYRAINYFRDKDGKFVAGGGDSYVAITEFGNKPKAMVLLSYGNSTQPGNKHMGDQLKLLSEKKLRPALLNQTDVLKNLEEKEVLTY